MAIEIEPQVLERIEKAYFLWLTTVREDGMPQPTPIWFVWHDDSILLYSKPDAQKLKNIRHNSKVALNFSENLEGEEFFVIMGEAQIDESAPKSNDVPAYQTKYAKGIPDINMTPDSLAETYSVAIRVRPTQIRAQ